MIDKSELKMAVSVDLTKQEDGNQSTIK
jgi:hypothetical protein